MTEYNVQFRFGDMVRNVGMFDAKTKQAAISKFGKWLRKNCADDLRRYGKPKIRVFTKGV